MTSVKVKFRVSSVTTREGTLYYQVIHGRVPRQISTGYRLFSPEWDRLHAGVLLPADTGQSRYAYLSALRSRIAEDTARLKNIVSRLERAGRDYTSEDVVRIYLTPSEAGGFVSFACELVRQLRQMGRERTAERYAAVMNSFRRFLGERDVLLEETDSDLMVRYETFLKARGICPNSSSYYMRGLRAIYNRAAEKGLTVQRKPFRHVYTGIDRTVKRAVPLRIIRQIRGLDLTLSPAMDFARDMFMFSFYTRGMSFIDMAFLKKKDLQNGILSYRRHKTGRQLFIKWEKPMQEITGKYDIPDTPYLLPIIRDMGDDGWRQYKNAVHLVNAKLKKIGDLLGLPVPLTSYVARHAWASIARSRNIPVSTISEAMGHDSEGTTRIYLASLDTSAVDRANSLVLRSL